MSTEEENKPYWFVRTHKLDLVAYLLWLIRENKINSVDFLHGNTTDGRKYFSLRSTTTTLSLTGRSKQQKALDALLEAGFVERQGRNLYITPLLWKLQLALRFSLEELLLNPPERSMRVTPVFGIPDTEEYTHDILVLMPFTPELKPIFDTHIKALATKLEMTVARADDFFRTRSIMEEIWGAMVHCRVIIADCTGRNPNVFYEIGIAHTLGKPVILITQNPEDIPFDLRNRRYITYDNNPHGIERLEEQLERTILDVVKYEVCDSKAFKSRIG